MSYLSPLSSCSSPGWNDPPTVIDHSKKTSSSGSGALINKHRRPVHPSIQVLLCAPCDTKLFLASSNQVVLSNSLQPVFSPQTPLSTFNPTLVSFAPSGQGTPNAVINSQPMASVPVPNHTCVDSFIPYSPSVSAETKKVALDESLYPQQQKHRSVFDAFTITGNKGAIFTIS
ncbi:unnamed protein product [Thelazia callipaeda]|uniref:Nuclear receptor domain-containing protein n=1 Tax=Thelazia callipaeda TaxID=103827 RepID=A0A0N5CYQ0_THECL|nr:unnamed protein product [Thelazia callipaeda]